MKVTYLPTIVFTNKEVERFTSFRSLLYNSSNRGPWFGNPYAGSLQTCSARVWGYYQLLNFQKGLLFELEKWTQVKERGYPKDYIARFGREVTRFEIIRALKDALRLVNRALDMTKINENREKNNAQ